jgi:hypothetical protein
LSNEIVMAFLGINIFSYSIVKEYSSGVATWDRFSAPSDDWIGFRVEAAVDCGATREEILETLATAVYMGAGPAATVASRRALWRLGAIRGAQGQRG